MDSVGVESRMVTKSSPDAFRTQFENTALIGIISLVILISCTAWVLRAPGFASTAIWVEPTANPKV